jgi:long-chain acyl-CoA synthetase
MPLRAPLATPPAPEAVRAETLAGKAIGLARRHDGTALRAGTTDLSYAELDHKVRALARRLIALRIAPGSRVAVLGRTSPEWTVADLAVLAIGAVVVPVYDTNSPGECAYVLSHSGATAVLCEDVTQVAKILSVRADCPALLHVLDLDGDGSQAGDAVADDEVDARAAEVRPDDLATIVYTSGTTGPPKGCRLSHANLVAAMEAYQQRLRLGSSAVVFLFLPLAHVLARVTQLVTLDAGGTLAYWRGDAAGVLDDLALMAPTHLPAVPRIFEKIHARALAGAEGARPINRGLFKWALKIGANARAAERDGRRHVWLRARHAVADRLVLSRVRSLLGGNLELALTGAAPIAPEVLGFFDACGVLVLEGYGLTESCAAGTLNTPDAYRFGTVGRPLPGTELAIAEDGEILMAGPLVFRGYHLDDEATAAVRTGRWLRTGDLGAVDGEGFLRVTGRKKDLIITSSGKNVSPANIEAALRESRWITEAVVVGDDHPFLVALLTLDSHATQGLSAERIRSAVQADVDVANERFARIEQIKRFAILDGAFTQAAGELTPSLKVKRRLVIDRHATEIDTLYS